MLSVQNGAITLETESFGSPDHPAILLVMGATTSKLGWPDAMCEGLAASGHYVIRFDHRDTGRSTSRPFGTTADTVEDLVTDVLAIARAFKLTRYHLVGMSLGGFITQMIATNPPPELASITLIAAEPLGWDGAELPTLPPEFFAHFGGLADLDWSTREDVIAFLVEIQRLSTGKAPFDPALARADVERLLDYAPSVPSMFNHASLTTARDWTGAYKRIALPTLVIHGKLDPLLPLPNGEALAHHIPHAKLTVLANTGHELPTHAFPTLLTAITTHVRENG
ncbi:alpha/beta hydrolase [Devosia sp. WQ 349]|uniref:alpha/beta fold hydrolase n=1 Tax=Devosia sp. WQ 349K1 TaxID=2800329 RepID=UPI001904F10E|nr:alpha/beta hydrolase [Devosia sp. WQ 349K1]MBK1794031.1 alpha/beta hydrolase [Devosia sp. WQ 349K1]